MGWRKIWNVAKIEKKQTKNRNLKNFVRSPFKTSKTDYFVNLPRILTNFFYLSKLSKLVIPMLFKLWYIILALYINIILPLEGLVILHILSDVCV